MKKVVSGHALDERGCGLLGGDVVRELEERGGGGEGELGVGAGGSVEGDALPDVEAGDAFA